ncbi:hypothetical protein PQU92_04810 [Asticcacaulis sp. BYS171W]|uniref:DUF4136 domain-containing protein n=1 Tax=Asticcacaulis aquaticus TaxID=2984212 RepID=A0ABT5HRM1_9CAUL|nr:hypothetical protein [Asticcacaulis aquaticus]MDC7682583.1 hypothetical protein [Asticcacaulis aquaticus]
MRKLMSGAVLAVSLVTLAACTTATPYQPVAGNSASSMARGYSDQKIESNRYRLKFAGNSATTRETVEDYMLYRAAELALENGFDWFTLSGRNTKEDRTTTTTYADPFRGPYFGGVFWRYYRGPGWGAWGAWEQDETTFYRYEASAEVLLGKGPKPANDPNAYDAREVKQNLDPRIIRPAARQ